MSKRGPGPDPAPTAKRARTAMAAILFAAAATPVWNVPGSSNAPAPPLSVTTPWAEMDGAGQAEMEYMVGLVEEVFVGDLVGTMVSAVLDLGGRLYAASDASLVAKGKRSLPE